MERQVSSTTIAGFGLFAAILFVIALFLTNGPSNQLVTVVTIVPDKTAQVYSNEAVNQIETVTSENMSTSIAKTMAEILDNADATRQVEFQTAIANGENGIYQRIKMQLQAEGMTFNKTPTVQTAGQQ